MSAYDKLPRNVRLNKVVALRPRLTRMFARSSTSRDASWLAAGAVASQVLALCYAPILTRLYHPSDFGVLAVWVSSISIASVFACLRYEMAIPVSRDDEEATNVLALCLALTVSQTVLMMTILHFAAAYLFPLVGLANLLPYIMLFPLGFFSLGIHRALSHWLVRIRAYKPLAVTRFSQGAWQGIGQVGFGMAFATPVGLLLGDIVGRCGGITVLSSRTYSSTKVLKHYIRFEAILTCARRFKRFPLISSWTAALNAFAIWTLPLVFAAVFGLEIAGLLALAQRLTSLPQGVVADSVGKVFLGECARLSHSQPVKMLDLFRTVFKQQVLLGLGWAALTMTAPLWFYRVFGDAWAESGTMAVILIPLAFTKFVSAPLSMTFNVIERQELHAVKEILALITNAAIVIMAVFFSLGPRTTVALFSVGSSLCYVLLIYMAWVAIRSHTRERTQASALSSID